MGPPYTESTVFTKIWFAGQGNRGLTLTPSEVFILNEYLGADLKRAQKRFVDDLNRMRRYDTIRSAQE